MIRPHFSSVGIFFFNKLLLYKFANKKDPTHLFLYACLFYSWWQKGLCVFSDQSYFTTIILNLCPAPLNSFWRLNLSYIVKTGSPWSEKKWVNKFLGEKSFLKTSLFWIKCEIFLFTRFWLIMLLTWKKQNKTNSSFGFPNYNKLHGSFLPLPQ